MRLLPFLGAVLEVLIIFICVCECVIKILFVSQIHMLHKIKKHSGVVSATLAFRLH